jgi:hypothetical protein
MSDVVNSGKFSKISRYTKHACFSKTVCFEYFQKKIIDEVVVYPDRTFYNIPQYLQKNKVKAHGKIHPIRGLEGPNEE